MMIPQEFYGWVRRWRIGPGMNDNERTREFLKGLAEAKSGSLLERYGASSGESLKLMEEGLYSGFDGTVGDGWVPILDRLAEDLVRMGWDRQLDQVKEKFGTLRFYALNTTDEMEARIAQAESESASTCERCGAPGRLIPTAWLKTLCEGCDRKGRE